MIPPGARALSEEEQASLIQEMEEIIAKSRLFHSLDDEGRRQILESGYVASFSVGEALMRQGEAGDTMYLILRGTVRVHADTPSGRVELAELGRDACVGEVSVVQEAERTATVVAASEVDAVGFKRHRIMRVLDDYPKVRELLDTIIEGRAHDTIEKTLGS